VPESPEDFSGVSDMIPDGAVPVHAIRIVEFVDADGVMDMAMRVDGEVPLKDTVGVLEIVKHAFLQDETDMFMAWDECDDPDDDA